MIDWDKKLFAKTSNAFAVPITIVPIKSQPSMASYDNRGIWKVDAVTVIMENGMPLTTTTYTIDLRLSDYTVPPMQGDHMIRKGNTFEFDKRTIDGQGNVKWTLKASAAIRPELL